MIDARPCISIMLHHALLGCSAEMEKAYGYAMIKMAEGAAKKETDSTGEMKQAWESLVMGVC
jgi:hypothetical protein